MNASYPRPTSTGTLWLFRFLYGTTGRGAVFGLIPSDLNQDRTPGRDMSPSTSYEKIVTLIRSFYSDIQCIGDGVPSNFRTAEVRPLPAFNRKQADPVQRGSGNPSL